MLNTGYDNLSTSYNKKQSFEHVKLGIIDLLIIQPAIFNNLKG